MIGELLHFVKIFMLSLLVVFLMQIRIGDKSIEVTALDWLHQSKAAHALDVSAKGGAKFVRISWTKFKSFVSKELWLKTDF